MINESIWEKVDLIEKRFENRLDKSNVKFNILNPVWDFEKEDALNVFEMIDELNYLNDCCDNLIDDNTEYVSEINQMHKENKQLKEENKELKLQNGELLYQIGEVGKNNKTCRECECFITDIHYCYMWDMEVEANDVVVACDQRKVRKELKK